MRSIFILAVLFLILCPNVLADQVVLKNGDKLTGKIVRADGKKLVIATEFAGEVTVVWDAITEISSDAPLYLTLADGRTVSGLVSMTNGRVEIRSGAGGPVVNDKSAVTLLRSEAEQAAYLRTLDPGWFDQWNGDANLGIALTKGNSDTTSIALGMAISRTTTHDKTSLYAAAIYSSDSTNGDSRTTANTIRSGLRYERNINRKWFGYGFTDFERNALQDLNLRWVLGGGIGYRLIRSERTQLDLLGGLAWNREYFSGFDNDRSSAEAQIGQTLDYRLGARTTFKEQLYFFPNLSNGGEYRVNFDASLQTDITRRIGWRLGLSDRYLSNPLPGLEKNDLILTTGVSMKIGVQ